MAFISHGCRGLSGELGEPRIGKAHRFERAQRTGLSGEPFFADFRFRFDDAADLRQKPRIDPAGGVNLSVAHAEPHRLRHSQ